MCVCVSVFTVHAWCLLAAVLRHAVLCVACMQCTIAAAAGRVRSSKGLRLPNSDLLQLLQAVNGPAGVSIVVLVASLAVPVRGFVHGSVCLQVVAFRARLFNTLCPIVCLLAGCCWWKRFAWMSVPARLQSKADGRRSCARRCSCRCLRCTITDCYNFSRLLVQPSCTAFDRACGPHCSPRHACATLHHCIAAARVGCTCMVCRLHSMCLCLFCFSAACSAAAVAVESVVRWAG